MRGRIPTSMENPIARSTIWKLPLFTSIGNGNEEARAQRALMPWPKNGAGRTRFCSFLVGDFNGFSSFYHMGFGDDVLLYLRHVYSSFKFIHFTRNQGKTRNKV